MSILLPEGWLSWSQVLDGMRLVRGPGGALLFGVFAACLLFAAAQVASVRKQLETTGLFPAALALMGPVLRVGSGLCGAVAIVALLPATLLPALFVLFVAASISAGLSARNWLPDLLAGAALRLVDDLQVGEQVAWGDQAGQVRGLGLRTVRVQHADGTESTVPARALLRDGYTRDRKHHPSVSVQLVVEASTRFTLDAAREATLLSPWRATGATVHVEPPLELPGTCTVRTRIVAWEHAEDHASSVRRIFRSLAGNDEDASRVDDAS